MSSLIQCPQTIKILTLETKNYRYKHGYTVSIHSIGLQTNEIIHTVTNLTYVNPVGKSSLIPVTCEYIKAPTLNRSMHGSNERKCSLITVPFSNMKELHSSTHKIT
jgi:hypothetical protein